MDQDVRAIAGYFDQHQVHNGHRIYFLIILFSCLRTLISYVALLQTKNPPDSLITEWLASETEQARAYHNGRFYLFKLLAQGVALVSPNDFTVS